MGSLERLPLFTRIALLLVTIGFLYVILPFWQPILWAVILTVVAWPLQKRMTEALGGRRTLSAVLVVLLLLIVVLIPAMMIAGLVADGALLVVDRVNEGAVFDSLRSDNVEATLREKAPRVVALLESLGVQAGSIEETVRSMIAQAGTFVATNIIGLGQGAAAFFFQLFIMLYLIVVFLIMGDQIYGNFFRAVPLPQEQKAGFAETFASMASATLMGMFGVGIVQGALGAFIFWVLGLEGAFFWGAVMGLLSVVPPFGAGFVWFPAGVLLALQGDVVSGVILILFGMIVISMSDNIVRPILVGRASSVPDYLVLITTLGGLIAFGFTGLVLGPILAALFLTAWGWTSTDTGEEGA